LPEDNPWGDRQLAVDEKEFYSMLKKGVTFSNDPGKEFEYSNLGYAMLGQIVQKVSGEPYDHYVTKNILEPLGMKHTYWEYTAVPEKNLALGYRYLEGKWVVQPMLHHGVYGAMGGLITTIEDFAKYVSFHLSAWPPQQAKNGPLKTSSIREMQKMWQFESMYMRRRSPGAGECPMVSGYGYGLDRTTDCQDRLFIGHSGGLPGFGSHWMIMPQYGVGIFSFANVTYAPAGYFNRHVLDTLTTIEGLKPYKIPVSAMLEQRKNELVQLLPNWKGAETSGIFADNFFMDYFTDTLVRQCNRIFSEAGKITGIQEMVAENNLRGYFIIKGTAADIRISFTLTPENPAMIQEFNIRKL
jgi:CubicO group peptidase (beta-lactamase class C family)